MEPDCKPLEEIVADLDRQCPSAPLLALGQTVFWDEPMKGGAALAMRGLGSKRELVAGVHDTDYFAKWAGHRGGTGYVALPHNDTTTKGLWSAAAEFSALLGSETVVTRERLLAAGAKVGKVRAARKGVLSRVSEAWGWRGVVATDGEPRITAEKPLGPLFPELFKTLKWAVDTSLGMIAACHSDQSQAAADGFLARVCDLSEQPGQTLAEFYENLIPDVYAFAAGEPVPLQPTRTTKLLKFNRATCGQARFDLVRLFVEPKTREAAAKAYNEALKGSEIYTLDRFGSGAVPLDLFIPGLGRGTLRLGRRGGVVMTPEPVGFSFKKVETLEDLAAVVEDKFGSECVLVGKAVSLIGMLSREFVFIFHEGASSYTPLCLKFHRALASAGLKLDFNPILRVCYEPWDALDDCCVWVKLPEPFRRPFGVEELPGASFAHRWREVRARQEQVLGELATIRRPPDLIGFLSNEVAGVWRSLAEEYASMQGEITAMRSSLDAVKKKKAAVLVDWRAAKKARVEAERAKGEHWRAKVFMLEPDAADWAERERLSNAVHDAIRAIRLAEREFAELDREQSALFTSPAAQQVKERRRDIALEAEIARMSMIRDAVVSSAGITKAGHRPSAWWFPLVCPDGKWFRATLARGKYRLEPLV